MGRITRRRRHVDAEPDPTLAEGATDALDATGQEERDTSVQAALERVLAHAESHGEVYIGASEDHAILRAAIEDGDLPGDQRLDDGEGEGITGDTDK